MEPGVIGGPELEAALRAFEADDSVLAVYLHGSAASGHLRAESDVDLAILPEPGRTIGASRLFELATQASLALGRQVDPGELSSRNLVYAREALLKGRRIFVRDRFKADLAAASLLGLYTRFQEERREVLDAYTA